MALQIHSPAFDAGGVIPTIHTCEGEDLSPELAWSGVPAGAETLVLLVEDPDAPDPAAPAMTWVHWVLYNLPANCRGLDRGIAARQLPDGTGEGINDWDKTGYGGPCPPVGRHRYFFRLFALDTVLPDLDRPSKARLQNAMEGHVIAEAELMGTYARQGG